MIEITIHIPALDRVADAISAAGGLAPAPSKAAPKAEAPKPAAKPKDQPQPEPEAPAGADDQGAAEGPTQDDVTAAAKRLQTKNGRDALVALLKEHGAANISGLDPSAYQAFIDAANEATA